MSAKYTLKAAFGDAKPQAETYLIDMTAQAAIENARRVKAEILDRFMRNKTAARP